MKIGEAFTFGACNPKKFTSIAHFKIDNLEHTLAHELAHNLGAKHDDEIDQDGTKNCKGKLLNSETNFKGNSRLFEVSKCTIDSIKKRLIICGSSKINHLSSKINYFSPKLIM